MLTLALFTLLAAGVILAQAEPPALKVSMIALGVKDPARSLKFYQETLGMKLMNRPGEVTILQAGEVQIVLNQPLGDAANGELAGAVEVIFSVTGVVAAHQSLAERGCMFIREPREIFGGTWAATFTDPDGHRLTILGPR